MYPRVVPAAGSCQQEALFRFPLGQKRWARVYFGISQGFREGLVTCLRQQENADDADKSAAGKDNMVKEIALLIVELHDGRSQPAKAGTG